MGKITKISSLVAALAVIALSVARADVTLIEGTAKIVVDPTSQAGMKEWSIGGQNQAYQQWFWYRLPGVGQNQSAIQTGATLTQTTTGTDKLNLKYNYGSFTIDVFYNLEGSLGNTASLIQNVGITNLTGSAISLDFYQYNDFNLAGTAASDNLQMDNSAAFQEEGGLFITEGGVQPLANYFEANTTGGTSSTLYKLNNTTDLLLNGNTSVVAGDATWAFQWHIELAANQGQDIIKNQNLAVSLIPEPSVLSLAALGLGISAFISRRRNS